MDPSLYLTAIMQPFAPGDRVVAINTDLSKPIMAPPDRTSLPFSFPDGPLRRDRVYHVEAVHPPVAVSQKQPVKVCSKAASKIRHFHCENVEFSLSHS